jgi:hypothetical protein
MIEIGNITIIKEGQQPHTSPSTNVRLGDRRDDGERRELRTNKKTVIFFFKSPNVQ